VVSIRDFEDLVTASGEVAKAQAIWVWDSFERTVHVTVAAQQGAILDPDTLARLTATLRSARDPNRPLHAANYSPVPIVVHANVEVQPDRERVAVEKAARAALTDALSFDRRDLGRPVHLSDVYRVLQDVDGVLDADVTELHRGASLAVVTQRLSSHVRVEPARPDRAHPGQVLPAELAMVRDPERDLVVASTGGADA